MNARFEVQMLTRAMTRWLYPGWCAVCKANLHLTEDHVCRGCFMKLPRIQSPVCRTCGVEMPPHLDNAGKCSRCRKSRKMFDEVSAIFRYDDNFKSILHQIKYERKYWLLETFSRKIQRALENESSGYTLPAFIVPVPMDKKRLRERTFNQAQIIAQTISKILNVPVREDILLRRENRIPQSHLNRNERLVNLEGQFYVNKPIELANQWVLVVDDVVTTGATVHECSKAMKEAGAAKVSVFALARTPSMS